MSLYLLPLTAWGLNHVINQSLMYSQKKNKLKTIKLIIPIIVFVFIWYPGLVSFQFALNPVTAKIAKADNSQYANSWAAGWGVKESIDFFKEQSKNKKIYIATEGTFGLLPAALEMYLVDDKNIRIKGYWPVDEVSKEVLDNAKKMPAYFVFYQKEHIVVPLSFPLKLLFQIRQGNTEYYYRVYQVIP